MPRSRTLGPPLVALFADLAQIAAGNDPYAPVYAQLAGGTWGNMLELSAIQWHQFIATGPSDGSSSADADRFASLQDLARWCVTAADLDWEHLDAIDRLGWEAELGE